MERDVRNRDKIAERLATLSPAKRALLERRRRGEAAAPQAAGISPRPDTGPAPLSFAQRRMWFLDQFEPGSPTYNLRVLLRLSGALDRAALAAAFQEVVRRHEVLRTAFRQEPGASEPVQVILPDLDLPMPLIDLSALPADRRGAESLRRTREIATTGFDLSAPPLVRVALLELEPQEHHLPAEHYLVVAMHHIVSDGWSMGVMVQEIGALYAAFQAGAPSPLPPLPVQYADFAVWQREHLTGEVLERDLGYWREHLAGAAAELDLPTDRVRPAVPSSRGAAWRFAFEPELMEGVETLARREGATPFMVLAAGLFALLSRLSGQQDLTLGSPVAARHRPEVEGLIGFFVNTLVFRADLAKASGFRDLLGQVRESALGAFAHQEVPFERLVAELAPDGRDTSRTPLFQVALALQNAPLQDVALAGLRLHPEQMPVDNAKFDLAFIVGGESGPLAAALEYATDLFDRTSAARLCGQWLRLLGQGIALPETALPELDLLSPAEHQQILLEWNDTEAPVALPGHTLLHEPFELQAERHPEALAAVWEGHSATYRELEARANQLASFLRGLGAGPGAPVGVWMDRSLDMLVALLGSCKAGAAYLPIDASWPAERAEAVLAGTQAHFVLTRTDHLASVQALQWRLPSLGDAICLDVATPELPTEPLDVQATQELWDVIAERATDWVTAGGFYSAYTGEPFSEAEVLEYRDRVLGLAEPFLGPDASGQSSDKRVLEIGNGSGLILWELAPRVGHYVGIDPSERTQANNRERAARDGVSNVELRTGFAHEIEALPAGSFDLVILASTVQFFPGLVYLEKVLGLALERLAPGGAVVIADVMDPRRREDFRRSLAEYAAAHPGSAAGRHREARELMVDEAFFAGFPGTDESRVLHREEWHANELRFRYDVVLRKEEAHASAHVSPRHRAKRVWTGWHVGQSPATRPAIPVSPLDIAYVIHTSGSTGEPKGIVVQHRPAVELCRWISTSFGVGPHDRLLFITSPAFDLSVYDVFGVLGAGGTVHVAPEGALRDPERMVRLLVEEPITIWDSAPAALQQLAPLLPEPGSAAGRNAALRLVMLSGDWIPVKLPDVVRASFPGARVMSLGGATEATVWSNFFPVEEVDPRWPSIPYGRPIANARYHVLDAALQPCPIGIPGDLYIGGGCLCVGYARLPAMTAERFIPDPYASSQTSPGDRLYMTGDRARYLVDGNLEFLGRVDQQVKVRGYRIELEEIEAVLVRQPGVREAAVVVREDVPGDKRLVGYFVPSADPAPTAAELRLALGMVMPEYMVPWTIVHLDRMPVTANGKLDRKGLPAPQDVEEDQVEYVAPETEMEHAIARIWGEVLGMSEERRIGLEDNFFELGGSSLVAAQVIARVRQLFAVEMPLRALFENRTLGALAARVDQLRATAAADALPPLVPEARPERIPLSFAQQRLWLVDQLGPGSALYNIPGAVRLAGPLDPALLGRVLNEIVRRHEVLRTTFAGVDGQPVQVIAAEGTLPLTVLDLSHLPAEERDAEAQRRATAEAQLPFDLARGPLLRASLLRLGPEEHVVLVTFHHIVSDAWSVEVFFREIAALFRAWSVGEPSPLPELPVQYADFALWQRRRLTGEVLERELDHWKQRLADAPRILELPTDRPRPAFQSLHGATRRVHLEAALLEPLAALGRQTGTTPFMNVLAAYATLLSRHAGQEEVLVGSPIAGRGPRETEGLIGFFVNTLVLRADLTGNPTFCHLLDRIRATALDAYAHQEVPFERLVDALVPVRDPSHAPLFQVVLALQDAPAEALRLPGLEVTPMPVQSGTAKVDLLLSLIDHQGELTGLWEYNTDLFDAPTIDRLTGQLRTLLAAAGQNVDLPVSELPLLTEAERHQLWTEWNDTQEEPPLPDGLRLDQLFTASAARWPERIALRFGPVEVTYRELQERAEALARHLRVLGVGPDVRVGICAEEGIGRIVGVVGTLLAGGGYVPLDPAHPGERLAWMLQDSGVQVLLTEERLLAALPHREDLAGRPIVCLDAPIPEAVETGPAPQAEPDNLAYIIYTSGSTGRPNGVMVSHRTAVHLIGLAAEHTRADETSRVLQLVSFSFDASVLETWLALSAGGTLVIVDRETRMSGPALAEAIRREGITQMAVPPPILTTIPHEGITSLRTILVGGDRCTADLANRWVTLGPDFRILNCYGPTETTIYAGFHRCVGPYRRDPSIGRPIANLRMMVLDRRGNPVPVGVPGELWVGGAQTVRGYWNRPELTAQRLVPDPGSEEPGARAYRSGDLVRLLPDGEIEFLGRVDRQVKLRGLRIELGEIEATLAEHPGVRECTVMVREDVPGETLLTAYLVPNGGVGDIGGTAPESRELRDFLAGKLPSYMVPGVFVTLEAMPLSPTGKVDRKALPVPAETRNARGGRESVAPRNPVEETLAEIWRQVLNRETVGVYDNFFELGGDSILGIQVVSRAQQAGLGLTARDLFQYQTVAELAELAAAAGTQESADIPLTAAQQALLERTPEAELGGLFELRRLSPREDLDPARLEQALRQVMERHDALRVRFTREDGPWRQLPAEAPVTLETSESALRAGFDVAQGPLLRAALVELEDWTQRLVLAVHRLAADRASWRLLLADLEAAYRGEEIPPVPVSFRQWASRPAEALPTVPDPGDQVGLPDSLSVELEADETRSLLDEVGPAFRTNVEDAVLTALLEAFGNRGGEPRLRVDVEPEIRRDLTADGLDVSRTVGRLAATVPRVLQTAEGAGPGERLKAVKEQLRAAPAATTEPAGVLFRSLETGAEPVLFAPLLAEPAANELGHALEITAEVANQTAAGQLRLTWSFDEGRHDESTVQRLADSTLASLRSLIEHCRTGEGGGFTASDFPEARFSQKDLDSLMSQLGRRKLKAGPAGSQ